MPKAYWINTFRSISDPKRVAEYIAIAGPAMRAAGGRFLARGDPARTFELGTPERTTLIEFTSVEHAVAAYQSPAYQAALDVLGDAAERDLRIIEATAMPAAEDTDAGTVGLAGQVVIVTGASSGIGQATATAFARAGAWVLGVGRRADDLAATATEHSNIRPFVADLRDGGAIESIVAHAVETWGRVDVLVNNAGILTPMPLAEVTSDRIDNLMATNVTAPSLLARAALTHLKRSRGVIVNVSSTFGHRPAAGVAHYAASKAALEQLTRSWALELAPHGIRVNAVAPGPTESRALQAAGLPDDVIASIKADEAARIPLQRRGEPAEVAEWILRLADPGSTWITGQVISVDGGLDLT